MSEYKYLQTRREGAAFVVTMTNPPKNLMNTMMVAELTAVATDLENDNETRALILTGGVEGIFITHYDVGELAIVSDRARQSESIGRGDDLHDMHRLLLKLQSLPQVVIAAINGTTMGGGCELALACDFRLMEKRPGAVMGLPEVRVGILPGAGGTQRMTRLLGVAKAMELMLLGNTVDAETAERIGLVHRAVEPGAAVSEAGALGAQIAERPALSVRMIKQCILQGSEMPLLEGLRFEQEAFWKTMRSEDARRLMKAYLASDRPLDEQ
jgi:enoyl-CoA hydratase